MQARELLKEIVEHMKLPDSFRIGVCYSARQHHINFFQDNDQVVSVIEREINEHPQADSGDGEYPRLYLI